MEIYWTDREVEVDFNEDGAVFGSIYTPTIELKSGRRFAYVESFRSLEEVEGFIASCKEIKDAGKNVFDVQAGRWVDIDPSYGSKYHQSIGDAHLMSDEELRHNNNHFAC
jgi:hypothetical protein